MQIDGVDNVGGTAGKSLIKADISPVTVLSYPQPDEWPLLA
jgi:hypothetical protein